MAEIKVVMNLAGARAIRLSPEVQADLQRRAEAIAAAANSHGQGRYEAKERPGKNRARSIVATTDADSMRDNAKNDTIRKSMDAGR